MEGKRNIGSKLEQKQLFVNRERNDGKEERKGRKPDPLFPNDNYAFAAPVFLIDSATSLIFAFTDSIFPSGIFALISSAILL